MQIISDPGRDIHHPHKPPGSYEWWYFDAYDPETETGLVVIFFDGLLFSPDYLADSSLGPLARPEDHPGIHLAVYKGRETLFYALSEYEKSEAAFGSHPHLAKIGRNVLTSSLGQNSEYTLRLEEHLPGGDSLTGELRFASSGIAAFAQAGADEHHVWNLVQPKAGVEGKLTLRSPLGPPVELKFRGQGYHDHNIGYRPLQADFVGWSWGRVHFPDSTLVWYHIENFGGLQSCAWLLPDGVTGPIALQSQVMSEQANLFGLKSPGAFRLLDGLTGDEIALTCAAAWDEGPFYRRFPVRAERNHAGKVSTAVGIGEFLRPDRIGSGWIRPLVRMRLTRQGRTPHWVQRFPRLYRLTW